MTVELTFTEQTAPGGVSSIEAVAFGNGIYCAVESDGADSITSPDAITWTNQGQATDATFRGMFFDGDNFLATGQKFGSTPGRFAKSADGITWSVTNTQDSGVTDNADYNGSGLYLGVDHSTGIVASSPDGLDWTAVTTLSTTGGAPRAIAYGAGVWVVTGSEGILKWSDDDGATWSAGTGDNSVPALILDKVEFDGDQFIASAGSNVAISSDGKAWIAYATGIVDISAIGHAGGTIIAAEGTSGTGKIAASDDGGQTWTVQTTPISGVGYHDAIGNPGGKFVLVGDTGGTPRIATADAPSAGPTTPEEKFNASYADASAALPKITALIRPADVQRSIDTDVSNLAGGPNLYVVEAIFDIGELQNLNPYNPTTEKPRVFFVQDDQPGLREGKNLLLKGYTIRDADPSVPVTCTFWG